MNNIKERGSVVDECIDASHGLQTLLTKMDFVPRECRTELQALMCKSDPETVLAVICVGKEIIFSKATHQSLIAWFTFINSITFSDPPDDEQRKKLALYLKEKIQSHIKPIGTRKDINGPF